MKKFLLPLLLLLWVTDAAAQLQVLKGSADVKVYVFLQDATTGAPETGITITNLDLQYVRNGAAPSTKADATALAATDSAHTDNACIEIDATDQPGMYRCDFPDAAFATGVDSVVVTVVTTGVQPAHKEFQLVAFDSQDATPAVNITEWLGTAAATPTVAGVPEVDVTHWIGTAAATPTVAGVPEVDLTHVNGAATTATLDTIKTQTGAIETDTQDIQSRLPAALVSGRMDSSVGAMAANTLTASATASDTVTELRSVASGTADSGSTTTMVDAARTEGDADYWKDMAILFTSGTITGQTRLITAFIPGTDTITFSPATTQAVGTNTYEIHPNVAAAGAAAPTAAENADAVWDELAADHVGAGSTGERIERLDIIASGGTGGLTNARAVLLDNLDAAITSRLAPTTAGRTLDVTATGEAGLDLDNTAGTLAKTTDITGFNDLSAAQVNTEADTAIADARLDELLAADSDIDGAAPPAVGSVFHEALTKTAGSFTFDQTTDSLEGVRDNMGTAQTGDSFARLGAPAGASVSADVAGVKADTAAILVDTSTTLDDLVDDLEARIGTPSNLGGGATVAANLSDVEGQTDDIGVAGAGLTAIPSSDVPKNQALSDFVFVMVDATDHVTPETGLTITGQLSCDAAAFAGVTGTIAEIGSGFYQFDAAAGDTNCNVVTWKFSASGADTYSVQFRTRQ